MLGRLETSYFVISLNCITGHFYFTNLLIPALVAGSKSSQDGKARVVTLSSLAAYMTGPFDLELAKDTPKRKKVSLIQLYGQSKIVRLLAYFHILFSQEVRPTSFSQMN